MIRKNLSQFESLTSNVGNPVLVEYFSENGTRVIQGALVSVSPLDYIVVNVVYNNLVSFLDGESSIKTVLDKNANVLYHNPFILSQPETKEELNWLRYYSGFLDEDLEQLEKEHKITLAKDEREFEEKKSFIIAEGQKYVKEDLRSRWNSFCNDRTLLFYSLEPAIDVMRELHNGIQVSLMDICKKYGLSGYNYNTMINAINTFSNLPHKKASLEGKLLEEIKS